MIRTYDISDSGYLQSYMAYVGYVEVCLLIKDHIGKIKKIYNMYFGNGCIFNIIILGIG